VGRINPRLRHGKRLERGIMLYKIIFELREDHLKLVRRMNVGYRDDLEFGAPVIDPKRPYGNSDVFNDIAKILGIEPEGAGDDEPEFTEDQKGRMLELHKETATALQVILAANSFELGIYESEVYKDNWRRVQK